MNNETLLLNFHMFTNIPVWYYWWYDISVQYWWHVQFGLCWYWVSLVFGPLGRYSQREYQIISSVFQIESCYFLPLVYHMFQLQKHIYIFCKSTRRQRGQMIFWSYWLWWRWILVSHTRIFQQVLFLVFIW